MILKSILFSAFALLSVNQTDKLKPAPASNLRFVENKAFGTSEHLKYRLHYGFINADGFKQVRAAVAGHC